jgi:hypothetical protein
MTDQNPDRSGLKPELSAEELEQEGAADLPDREAMSLLNLTVNLDLGLEAAAPINAAAAANLNIAAPIDAAVSANIASVDSTSMAVADQDSIIIQNLEADATATADQTSSIEQGG